MTTGQLAIRLGISRQHAHKLAKEGKIPGAKRNKGGHGHYRFAETANFKGWLEKNAIGRRFRKALLPGRGRRESALKLDSPIYRFPSVRLSELLGWFRSRPDDFWEADRRAIWKEKLQPLVKVWEAL
jgi:excisionase family DNA binding protein